ncbi:3-deoxy-D-arabino-heptulosonate 7-phosphate synthase [Bordetella petrii]|uniref:3-deoxy-D-arabino-heptulosonate 7-phosphate synthase n=1 Tax=Bordetella petrii TaxID=94624 RepID=UPI001A961B2B|nr:3-deoxy-D-arabino-heptulosonate 7-phosphate synthase [Bordetella petrii]MBO1112576.1 3-deoxy-D-arabino-heptulosonate 7-phosphate synthase [Bordetella petrii]
MEDRFPSSPSFLLAQALRTVPRPYCLSPALHAPLDWRETGTATALAACIEQARLALARDEAPGPALKRHFTAALGQLVREAMRPGQGDPAFQAMVLRHGAAHVREYASLAAHAGRDRRAIRTAVDAMAHPARQQRVAQPALRQALARLHGAASWPALADAARQLHGMPEAAAQPALRPGLDRLLQDPALARLQRLDALQNDALVRQYQALWDRQGPRQGSPGAIAAGSAAKQRGDAVEALAAQALQALARRLNQAGGAGQAYRVATSLRVPAALSAGAGRAKSEWDAALLRQGRADGPEPGWDVCLLVEAKASADAAITDLPRLLRGLRLLVQADPGRLYAFQTEHDTVSLRGASLHALDTGEDSLAGTVLYCCDAPVEAAPRLLGAASRMQLLSAPPSLDYAGILAQGRDADDACLEPVWETLLAAPGWRAVLHQYPTLRQVRALMVRPADLLAAAGARQP